MYMYMYMYMDMDTDMDMDMDVVHVMSCGMRADPSSASKERLSQ